MRKIAVIVKYAIKSLNTFFKKISTIIIACGSTLYILIYFV